MKVIVTKNGPYIVTGGVPLIVAEICNDNEGYCPDLEDRQPVSCEGEVRPLPLRLL